MEKFLKGPSGGENFLVPLIVKKRYKNDRGKKKLLGGSQMTRQERKGGYLIAKVLGVTSKGGGTKKKDTLTRGGAT